MPIKVGRWWGKEEISKGCDFFLSTSQTDQASINWLGQISNHIRGKKYL